jgi:hypothetical protein
MLSVAVVLAVGILAGTGGRHAPRAESKLAAGVLSQSNSKAGSAILNANNLAPGDTSSGTVTITNTGTLAGQFELDKSGLSDVAGPGGGALSGALDLQVQDLNDNSEVYQGALDAMPTRPLGTFQPGESHTYRFTVGLPDRGGAVDNLFEGATTSVQYNWVAHAEPAPDPVPEPKVEVVKPKGPANDLKPAGPKVTVKVPRRQRIMRQHGIYVRVRCDRPCTVDIKVRLKAGARVDTPSWHVRRALPGKRTVRIKVTIPPRELAHLRALLRRTPSIRILLSTKAKDRKRG